MLDRFLGIHRGTSTLAGTAMRIVSATLLSLLFLPAVVHAQPGQEWEIRRTKTRACEVKLVGAKLKIGDKVAGPFQTQKRAEIELAKLKKTKDCRS
jgi:hypothetical protein